MPEIIEPLTQFGVAGLMGLLWVWERRLSRMRERQLGEAHERLMAQRAELDILVQLVRQNTRAIARFERTLGRVVSILARPARQADKRPT